MNRRPSDKKMANPPAPRRRLNLKVLFILLGVGLVFAVGVHFLHGYQVKQNATALLDRAHKAQDAGQLREAVELYGSYLAFRPTDDQALADYGLALRKLAGNKDGRLIVRAVSILEQAVRRNPDRHDLRREIVDGYLVLNEPQLARDHIRILLKEAAPDDPHLEALLGRALQAEAEFRESSAWYFRSLRHGPPVPATYQALTLLLRDRLAEICKKEEGRPNETTEEKHRRLEPQLMLASPSVGVFAVDPTNLGSLACVPMAALHAKFSATPPAERQMDLLVAANHSDYQSHLARWRYRRAMGLPDFGGDLANAHKLAPEAADVLLALVEAKQDERDYAGARDLLREGIQRFPTDPRMYDLLVSLEQRTGRQAEAIAVADQGLKALAEADQLSLLLTLSDVLIDVGKVERASDIVGELEKKKYKDVIRAPLTYLRGRLLLHHGQLAQAAHLLEEARPGLASSPVLAVNVNLYLARCYEQLGNPDQQLNASRRAVEASPMLVVPRLQLAAAHLNTGALDEARKHYEVVSHLPLSRLMLVQVMFLKNLRLEERNRNWVQVDEAIQALVRDMPHSGDLALLQARVLAARGEVDAARQVLAEALRDWPNDLPQWATCPTLEDALRARPNDLPEWANCRTLEVALGGRVNEFNDLPEWANCPTLDEGLRARPKNVPLWDALANLVEWKRNWERAAQVIDQAEKAVGDTAEVRQMRIRHWSRRRAPESVARLTQFGQGLERYTPEERQNLRNLLTSGCLALGEPAKALEYLALVAEEQPNDVPSRVTLFELALRQEKEAVMRRAIEELRKIESADGTWWRYCDALRLLAEARRQEKTEDFHEVVGHIRELSGKRPNWGRVPLLEADLAELKKDYDQAIEKYSLAMRFGERRPEVIRRQIALLKLKGRYPEIEPLLRLLPEELAVESGLGRELAEAMLRREDNDSKKKGLEFARRAVTTSNEVSDLLWLSERLWQAGEREEAVEPLKQAVKQSPRKPEPWIALVQYYITMSRLADAAAAKGYRADAKATIEQASKELPEDQRSLTLAQCYEQLGPEGKARAESYLSEAYQARPDDLLVLRAMGGFQMRVGQPEKAMEYFRKIIAQPKVPDEALSWARRSLALALAAGRQRKQLDNAIELLDQNLKAFGNRAEDVRSKAMVLTGIPTRRQEAIVLLDGLVQRQQATVSDRFLLAQLYERVGNWPRAKEHLLRTVNSVEGEKNAEYLAGYISGLIKRGEAGEAAGYLERLEKLEPGTARTLELRVRTLKATKRESDALDLLRKVKDGKPEVLAPLFEAVGAAKEAEENYRKYVAQATRPERVFLLIGFLARQNRAPEALALCEQAKADCPLEKVALAAVGVLQESGADPNHCNLVKQWLEPAVRNNPENVELKLQLASLHYLQGEYGLAEKLYRDVLERNARNATALNNLAWILALHGKNAAEALIHINRAIDVAGPEPGLLGTRGVIYLANQRPEMYSEALKDFTQANAEEPSPTALMHLAYARLQTKDDLAASDLWRKARAAGLRREQIDPLGRTAIYDLLHKKFN